MQLNCDLTIILATDIGFKHFCDSDGARFSINHAGILERLLTGFYDTLSSILVNESDLLRIGHLNATL